MKSRPPRRVSLVSLGCPKNRVDSETVLGEVLASGFELASDPGDADLVLINTCGFIAAAREESERVIAQMLALKDAAGRPRVVAMGCLGERSGRELRERFPALDAVLGFSAYGRMAATCRAVLEGKALPAAAAGSGGHCAGEVYAGPRLLTSRGAYAYLRIAEGCDNRCAYCAIPAIRGPQRSRPPAQILREARRLRDSGVRELVLIAQDTTRYGQDLEEGRGLAWLLRALLRATDVERIRLLYAHPGHIDDATLELLGCEPRLCGYLDLPLQHVNTRMLRRMRRNYDRDRIERILRKVRGLAPGFVLRTTVLVGFPGETEREYEELLEFVRAGHFQHLGAFTYSREADTPAAGMSGRVPAAEAAARRERILLAQQEVAFRWLQGRVGSRIEVMIDYEKEPGLWAARSVSEAPEIDGLVLVRGADFSPGTVLEACVLARQGYDIRAQPCGANAAETG